MNKKLNKAGFTIIEVVLVLAIAGLIFIMVFTALPALQSSQRDTARKNDVSIVVNAITNFASANRGSLPKTAEALRPYITAVSSNTDLDLLMVDSDGGATTITPPDAAIQVRPQTVCSDSSSSGQVLTAGTKREYTVTTKLEAGGGAYYCMGG